MLTYFLGTVLALFLALDVRCVPDDDGYLLPISVKPTAYNLSIALDANRTRFHGSVEIRATALTQTDSITLHCEELNITHSELYSGGSGGEAVRITRLGYDRDAQRCVFSLAESLTPRTDYVLALNFNGVYDYDLGITKEYYTTTVGTQKMRRWMIQTEFEPTYARRMFPCFDEPAYKARFSLRVGRPQNATVLSNMPLKSSTVDTANGVVWDEFEETPPMSTYLLAFVVFDGDLVNVTDPQTNSSVWLPGEWAQYADRPLYVAAKVVAFLQEYTGVPYSLPKLDHVPIPNPSHDGMENWGLITYRNYYFLYNEALYTLEEKQLMTGFLAHEITHQWFGDLVTMKWWNDTWLKEGFASYFQNYITSVIEPNWRVMEYFCVNTIQAAFYDDVISSALPVSPQSVKTRDEINDMFPIIMYWKGAITVHMLQNILSEETLKNGISHFLKNNAYGSVTEDDLWESLRKVKDNRLDIAEVMHSWIHESGFPLVTVQRENNSILLTQEKYLGKRSETGVRWWIPLTYTTSLDNNFNNTKIKGWFPPNATTHVMDLSFYNNEWIILNIGYTGYYRVNYDMLTWKLLAKYLYQCNANEIPAVTRAQVLDDVFALGASGHVDYKTAFDVAAFLQCETDFLPWATATTVFDSLLNKLYITEAYGLFKTYMLELASETYSKNSFQNMKSLDEKFTQSFVTPWACKLGHNHCQSTAVQIVSQMMSGENVSIPVDLMETAMCTAVRLGGEKVWSYLHQLYIETNDTANTLYRTHIINALACTLHRGTIHRLLTDIVSEADFINDDGSVFFMAAVANEKQNVPVLIDFLLENFTSVYKSFGVVQILSQLANVQTTAEDSEKMKKIITLLPAKETSASAIAEVLNKIRINDEWMSRHYDTIFQWLKDRLFTTDTTIASGEESTHDNKGSELDQQLYGLTTDLSQEGGPHLDSIPEATTHLLHTTTVKSNSTPVTTSSLLLALQVIICIVIIVY